jgi:hypothetical protein
MTALPDLFFHKTKRNIGMNDLYKKQFCFEQFELSAAQRDLKIDKMQTVL